MQAGATDDKIRQVPSWRDSELFSTMEKDALEYAEKMTITGEKVTDELWGRLRGHFTEAQLVELLFGFGDEAFRVKHGGLAGGGVGFLHCGTGRVRE